MLANLVPGLEPVGQLGNVDGKILDLIYHRIKADR
jgi:hypothetical protein